MVSKYDRFLSKPIATHDDQVKRLDWKNTFWTDSQVRGHQVVLLLLKLTWFYQLLGVEAHESRQKLDSH